MFYDYEDILSEPSEAEIVIEEMKEKLHSMIKNEAINIMEEYRTARNQLDSLNSEIRSKKNRISRLDEKIKELEEEHEQADKYKMPRKYIDKFVRDITGNYAPGDKVWIIKYDYDWIQCDKCKGKREIPAIVDGKEHMVKCIKCKGDGRTRETISSIKETTISNVYLKLCFQRDRVSNWTSDAVYVGGREYAISPKDIYRSKDEAEKELEDINGVKGS